jgi:OOP family OmpA-OmpF porin
MAETHRWCEIAEFRCLKYRDGVDSRLRELKMNSYIKLVFILSGLVFGASSAVAQSNFYVGVGGGQAEANELSFTDFDDGSGIAGSFDDSDFGLKLFGGYKFFEYFALELAYVDLGSVSFDAVSDGSGSIYAAGPVTGSVSAKGPSASAVGMIPVGDRFDFLIKAGFMAWDADVSVSNTAFGTANTSEDGTDLAYGLGAQFRFTERFSVRGEWERFTGIIDTDGQLLSLSVQYSFGGRAAATAVAAVASDGDIDLDGVADSRDACPNTPAGQSVDARGCGLDSDGDGVTDDLDQCPNTVKGATVDASGCEMDGDNDRVVDRLDECPNTRPGARVDVKGCEIREVISLPGVNFELNSEQLLAGSEQVLADAAATLRMNPDLIVEVAGHSDSAGNDTYNLGLSERRANTVRDYLVNDGANPDNLTAKGYGEAEPVADNASADGRASNRRVELRIQNR